MYPTSNTLSENIPMQSVELLNEHLATKMNPASQAWARRHAHDRGWSSVHAARRGDSDSAVDNGSGITTDMRDRIEIWVNEGGAGDDLDR